MSFTPAYNATFAKPLLNQLIALIERDQQAAIDLVNPSLAPDARKSLARVTLTLDIGQFDQDIAQDNGQDYVRVLDMVITTAPLCDYTAPLPITHQTVPGGTTTPSAPDSVKEVFVESHDYSLVTLNEVEIPVLRATLQVLFYLE